MTLRLHNTLTRSVDPLEPVQGGEGRLRMYGCGPTIYDHAHIGNYRTFMVYDLVHRYLEWLGHEVHFVMNLTDVDDKTILRAAETGTDIRAYTEPFGRSFMEGCGALGIREADAYPRATDHIEEMIRFVERLLERDHAYVTEDGSVYFSIASFPEYGKLSGVDLDQVKPGARVAVDEYGKDDVRDFVLWKAAKEVDEQVGGAWDSPWGRGRPGWHLECSVMSLGPEGGTLDLHLGGEDLIFPHHEDEIAQSEAATGEPFARGWLHVKHLRVEGKKMAKSEGNFILLKELLEEGHPPAAIRHLLLSAHYRAELNFTREGLAGSARAVQRLVDLARRLEAQPVDEGAEPSELPTIAREALAAFQAALDADLNTPEALAALFGLLGRTHGVLDQAAGVRLGDRDAVLDALRSMDDVLGLLELAERAAELDAASAEEVEALVRERNEARQGRDFARADDIRDRLAERGIVLEDGAGGTSWKRVGKR